MRGAEAVLRRSSLAGMRCVIKSRVAKGYRVGALDKRLRAERTRGEARLLHRAKEAGVPCPTVLEAWEYDLTLSLIEGKRPRMGKRECAEAGRLLAKLHSADIIHGDYTPANLMEAEGGVIHVIDFGLGYVSNDVEDKAVDVFTMQMALKNEDGGEGALEAFLGGYGGYSKADAVLRRVKAVEKRVRYAF